MYALEQFTSDVGDHLTDEESYSAANSIGRNFFI